MSRDGWHGDAVRRAHAYLREAITHGRMSGDCCLCGLPIDLSAEYPDRECLTVQHLVPRSAAPHLAHDPGNWAPAHMSCNSASGTSLAGFRMGRRSSW